MMNSTNNISLVPSTAQSLKVTWKVPGYFSLPDASGYSLNSPPFIFANATWCFRLYPNSESGMTVAPVRLHSLVSRNEIIAQFDVKLGEAFGKEDDMNIESGYGYIKFLYDEENVEHKYCIREMSRVPPLVSYQIAEAEPLELVCHLLSGDSTGSDKISQKCELDLSKIYDRSDEEKDSSITSLKSSIAQSFKIMWKIPEYFSLPKTSGYSLDSPCFDIGCATWFLKLYPNGTDGNPNFNVSLVRSHSLISCHKIICRLDIITEEEIYYSKIYEGFAYDKNSEYKFKDSIVDIPQRSVLFENCSKVAPNGTVMFLCHLFLDESTGSHEDVQKLISELDNYKKLCQD